jgi:hypothetical protein
MDITALTDFFMWCTIINGALLLLWTGSWLTMPELVFETQKQWFSMSRETFGVFFYGFLGFFKIMFLLFNLVPWIALMIIG